MKPVVEQVDYEVRRLPQGVALTVRRHMVTFVRETIPDGQMAGMIGHRPVPHVDEITFDIPAEQARRLVGELGAALE